MAFSVANTGDADSTPQTMIVQAPDGVTVRDASGTTGPTAPALRHRSAFVVAAADDPAQPAATVATAAAPAADRPSSDDEGLVRCTDRTCHYTVPAHRTLTVTLTLSLRPDAAAGTIALRIGGQQAGAATLTVGPALRDLAFTADTLRAGTTTPVPLTADVAPGVADPGTITLDTRHGDFWLTGVPDSCHRVSASTLVTCTPRSVHDGAADFGTFDITVLPRGSGAQTIVADLPGGRSAQVGVIDQDGHRTDSIVAAPLRPGDPVSLTGPFGGALVGGTAMYCDHPDWTRGDCGFHSQPMTMVTSHQILTIPDGATVLSATLTWAMSYPENGDPANLSKATFHIGPDGCADECDSHPIAADRVQTPVVDDNGAPRDEQGSMYVRAADVTEWVQRTGALTVWTDGLAPSLSAAPGGGATPMAGWALSVVWSQPGTHTTIQLSNPGTYSLSGAAPTQITLADAGPAIDDLSVVVWATDPQAHKDIIVGDAEQGVSSQLMGIFSLPSDGDEQQAEQHYATGFSLVTGVRSAPNESAVFVNRKENFAQNWAGASPDGLWLGPLLVIRDAQ